MDTKLSKNNSELTTTCFETRVQVIQMQKEDNNLHEQQTYNTKLCPFY
ncbi:unnamed protein product [Brassica rapa subsp. trilocularis]